MKKLKYVDDRFLCLSGIRYCDFKELTGLKKGEFNGKNILDIGSGLSDISINLSKDNPKGRFICLDPLYINGEDGIKESIKDVINEQKFLIINGILSTISGFICGKGNLSKSISLNIQRIKRLFEKIIVIKKFVNNYSNNKIDNLHRIAGIGEELPITNGTIDYVIISGFLYGVKNLRDYLFEVYNTLNENGELIISDYGISYNVSQLLLKIFDDLGIIINKNSEDKYGVRLTKAELKKVIDCFSEKKYVICLLNNNTL